MTVMEGSPGDLNSYYLLKVWGLRIEPSPPVGRGLAFGILNSQASNFQSIYLKKKPSSTVADEGFPKGVQLCN